MDRMKWLTEGGFSNPPIRRGEACLAHIPSLSEEKGVKREWRLVKRFRPIFFNKIEKIDCTRTV